MLSLADRARVISGSYAAEDVEFLLKPLALETQDVAAKEAFIQSGQRHYSEMLSHEAAPDAAYMHAFHGLMDAHAQRLAGDIAALAPALGERAGGRELALVSLARAGTPVGILLRRALLRAGVRVRHYSVSIIRDRDIDANAMRHILARHAAADLVFVDGWTGKGAIAGELRGSRNLAGLGIEPFLCVVADPAGVADLAAGGEDYPIPSGILNGIVSGLVSRSVLNDMIGPEDFHGCMLLDHLAQHDVSRWFVDIMDGLVRAAPPAPAARWTARDRSERREACEGMIAAIMARTGIADRNRIKPGIAEATRAVLRRVPERVFVRDRADPGVQHLLRLAESKNFEIEQAGDLAGYQAVTVIKSVGTER